MKKTAIFAKDRFSVPRRDVLLGTAAALLLSTRNTTALRAGYDRAVREAGRIKAFWS